MHAAFAGYIKVKKSSKTTLFLFLLFVNSSCYWQFQMPCLYAWALPCLALDHQFTFTSYNFIVPVGFLPWKIWAAFPGESLLQQSHSTQPTVYAEYLSVSIIHRTLTWTTGSFNVRTDVKALCTELFNAFSLNYFHRSITHSTRRLALPLFKASLKPISWVRNIVNNALTCVCYCVWLSAST